MKIAREREANTSKEKWIMAIENYGVDRIVFNACDALNEETLDLVQQDPLHFAGFAYCNVLDEESILDRW